MGSSAKLHMTTLPIIPSSMFGSHKNKNKLTALVLEAALRKEALSDHVNAARKRYNNLARWLMKNGRKSMAGLGLLSLPSMDTVITESTQLCKQYLINRLSKQNLLSPRMEYLSNPAYSSHLNAKSTTFSNISIQIQNATTELESMHPELYESVVKQLNLTLTSDTQVRKALLALAAHMYRGNITWGKVIAGFSLVGAMACDCVQNDRPESVKQCLDVFTKITRDYTAEWIVKQGGWVDLTLACKSSNEIPLLWTFSIIGAAIGFCVTLASTIAV